MKRTFFYLFAAFTLIGCPKDQIQKVSELTVTDYDQSCETEDECVQVPTCCGAPCGPGINKRDLERARKDQRELCDPTQQCDDYGDCLENRYICEKKRCVLITSDDPRWVAP